MDAIDWAIYAAILSFTGLAVLLASIAGLHSIAAFNGMAGAVLTATHAAIATRRKSQ